METGIFIKDSRKETFFETINRVYPNDKFGFSLLEHFLY